MDGQNFQNENNQYQGTTTDPVIEPAVTEPYQSSAYTSEEYSTGSSYQDNTSQYSDPYSSENAYSATADAPATPGVSIASLVLGIAGILFDCCCGVGIIFGIIGLILAIVGNKQQKSGVGTAGLVCSIIALVFGAIYLLYAVFIGGMTMLDSM